MAEEVNEQPKTEEVVKTQPQKNPLDDMDKNEVNDILSEVMKELEEEEKKKENFLKKDQLKAVAKELLKKQTATEQETDKTKEELELAKKELEEQKKRLEEIEKQSKGSKIVNNHNPLDTNQNEQKIGREDIEVLANKARNYKTYRDEIENNDYSQHRDFVHNFIKRKLNIRG